MYMYTFIDVFTFTPARDSHCWTAVGFTLHNCFQFVQFVCIVACARVVIELGVGSKGGEGNLESRKNDQPHRLCSAWKSDSTPWGPPHAPDAASPSVPQCANSDSLVLGSEHVLVTEMNMFLSLTGEHITK